VTRFERLAPEHPIGQFASGLTPSTAGYTTSRQRSAERCRPSSRHSCSLVWRLAEDLQVVGLGGELLVGALKTILAAMHLGGGRVIVVDAIDERAAQFYEHHGFGPLPLNPDRLVMKASSAAASLSITWP
jgi:hypothetical protein